MARHSHPRNAPTGHRQRHGDKITLGNGNNTVFANGDTDIFTFGNGNNKVGANGAD